MNDKSYTEIIKNAYKATGIHTTVQLHICRIQGARTLDVEEMDGLDMIA